MLAAFALLTGSAVAQTAPAKSDPIAQKFASLDADKSGFLDGKELEAFKDKLAFLDMDKDGKVSSQEFNVGVMTGVIN
jgi:Ca2+-binding EF-hand superfamily protein